MGQEITIANGLQVAKASLIRNIATVSDKYDMTGTRFMYNTQLIGTSEETIYIGDLTTVGAYYFRNLDATNYVEVGVLENAVFRPFLHLLLGKSASGYLSNSLIGTPPNSVLYAKANVASVLLEVAISER